MSKAVTSPDAAAYRRFSADRQIASGFAALREGGVDLSQIAPAAAKNNKPTHRDAWFEGVLDQLPICVYMTDAEGRVTYANRAAGAFVGREPRIGTDRWCVTHKLFTIEGAPLAPQDGPMAVALRESRPVRGVEAMLERPDGTRTPVLTYPTPLFGDDGALTGGFNLLVDISKRKQAEQKLADTLHHDGLTGLHNRPALSAHLDRRLMQARLAGEGLVVMRMDLDGFKALNDEHGHAVGDAILVEAAQRLRASADDAFLARIGGDEFMLVSGALQTEGEARAQAERVRCAFAEEFFTGGHSFKISVSAGCARFPGDGEDQIRLIAAANAALNLAKSEGSGAMRMFDLAEQAREQERLTFSRHLRQAIERNEIHPHYQPLFRADGSIAGFEALARWKDPVRGIVSPASFIPAAEEGGLIAKLDAYVLRSACVEAARWTQPLRISVNISALEFQSGELPGRVAAVLAETGLDPERLELEITEGVMVTDADRAMATFGKLRALGVRIALDDFGTGYSSLSYLHRFPLTTLKIDRSFIAKLGVTLESVAITRAVIQLGHALGIEVVAEGVETPEQLDFLIQEGCDLTQGFLLGRPLDASAYAHVTGA
ncbi:EAL domain-containing protein [Bosea sp. LjRoot9]|uniref:putative bifunctional diguanylate cyclase/phosphodiesterase n=1 Tax=Bosea sp. LjRoot9 TaxID=3342341 RepID=UPI003ECF2ECC